MGSGRLWIGFGADRRFPCRLCRSLRIPRIRPPRGVPAESRLAGLPGDLPSRHVCPRSGGYRFQETVSRGRAGCEAVRSVEKRSGSAPGGSPPSVFREGWWKASSSRSATRRDHGGIP